MTNLDKDMKDLSGMIKTMIFLVIICGSWNLYSEKRWEQENKHWIINVEMIIKYTVDFKENNQSILDPKRVDAFVINNHKLTDVCEVLPADH